MTRLLAVTLLVVTMAGAGATEARAQDGAPGPAPVVVTLIPGGATFFTDAKDDPGGPGFGNYGAGGSVAVHLNRIVALEGELTGAFGVSQSLGLSGLSGKTRTPNLVNYSANVLVSAPTGRAIVPYAAGGIGGLTLFERRELAIGQGDTFLTGNVGGGINWYAGRWGLRGDYRFIAVRGNDDAPAFFGRDERYGHRVYGGVLLNIGR